MGEKDTESQLASFFLYSFLIYPATNFLLSPQRQYNKKHGRWRGIIYASLLLATIAGAQLYVESLGSGPNFYQSLRATRHTHPSDLKRLYKKRMLETHPDKNKSPAAVEDFRRAKLANDVLSNPELRDIYDRLGEHGLRVFAGDGEEGVRGVDVSYVVVQMLMSAAGSVLLAFIMTLSEPSGEAFLHSMCALMVVLLLELVYVVSARPLPALLFPAYTPHEVMSVVHRLFPAVMNACRCICSSLYEDPFLYRVEVIDRHVKGMLEGGTEAVKTACAWQDRYLHQHRSSHSYSLKSGETEEKKERGVGDKQEPLASRHSADVLAVSSSSPVHQALRLLRRNVSAKSSAAIPISSDTRDSHRIVELTKRVEALDKQTGKCYSSVVAVEKISVARKSELGGGGWVESVFSLPSLCLYLLLQTGYWKYTTSHEGKM